MEQWEKEYIDAVTKSKQAKTHGKILDCSYEEGYDSSRWVEITLPDGKKHYVPKEAVGNRSRKRKSKNHYQAYYDSCWNELEKKTAVQQSGYALSEKEKKQTQRYYSDKVSFFRTVLKTIGRLLILFALEVLLIGITRNNPEKQLTITAVYAIASLIVVLHAVYYIIRCLFEKNLRL